MSSIPRMNVTYWPDDLLPESRSRRAARFRMNPPFDPSGTITAFFTLCAFMSPRTSVR